MAGDSKENFWSRWLRKGSGGEPLKNACPAQVLAGTCPEQDSKSGADSEKPYE
jgi:hypothetical protein